MFKSILVATSSQILLFFFESILYLGKLVANVFVCVIQTFNWVNDLS